MNSQVPPLVSIITATYNHEEFIGPCIDSLRAQSYSNWEQIIVDDGSQDRTAEIVAGYQEDRIKYLHQKNQGIEQLPHSYNRALAASRGELVAILEGDDVWPSNKLSRLVPSFEDKQVVLAYGMGAELSSDGKWSGRFTSAALRRSKLPPSLLSNNPLGAITASLIIESDLIPPSTVIIRRSALTAMGGFQYVPGLCVTDFPTFLRLSLEGTFHFVPEVMGYRRRHMKSVTLNNSQRISRAAREYAIEFAKRNDLQLSVSERERIEESWRTMEISDEFAEGRFRLLQKDWQQARAHFKRAANLSEPRILMASALGWGLSWLRCDLERIVRFAGKAAIRT